MTGSVNGFRLAFHKRSVDGSAKADAFFTDNPSDEVWGVVAQMSRADKSILDQFESLGIGYDEITVDVAHEHGVTSAWMYVARQEMIDDSLLPYSWYHNYVRAGALEHGLPQSYIEFIESFSSIEDPDHIRDLENRIE